MSSKNKAQKKYIPWATFAMNSMPIKESVEQPKQTSMCRPGTSYSDVLFRSTPDSSKIKVKAAKKSPRAKHGGQKKVTKVLIKGKVDENNKQPSSKVDAERLGSEIPRIVDINPSMGDVNNQFPTPAESVRFKTVTMPSMKRSATHSTVNWGRNRATDCAPGLASTSTTQSKSASPKSFSNPVTPTIGLTQTELTLPSPPTEQTVPVLPVTSPLTPSCSPISTSPREFGASSMFLPTSAAELPSTSTPSKSGPSSTDQQLNIFVPPFRQDLARLIGQHFLPQKFQEEPKCSSQLGQQSWTESRPLPFGIAEWNFTEPDHGEEAYPRMMHQFSDDNYLKTERMAALGLKLATGTNFTQDLDEFLLQPKF